MLVEDLISNLVKRFTNHNLPNHVLLFSFYNCFEEAKRIWLDDGAWAIGSHVLHRSHVEAMHLLNHMADFDYYWYWDPSLQCWSY